MRESKRANLVKIKNRTKQNKSKINVLIRQVDLQIRDDVAVLIFSEQLHRRINALKKNKKDKRP